jgi:hypothetical protein
MIMGIFLSPNVGGVTARVPDQVELFDGLTFAKSHINEINQGKGQRHKIKEERNDTESHGGKAQSQKKDR